MTDGCPHLNIVHCPLYHAGHEPDLLAHTCAKGDWLLGCTVEQGKERYADLIGHVQAKAPRLVAMCRWKEDMAAAIEQRKRNLRVNGFH